MCIYVFVAGRGRGRGRRRGRGCARGRGASATTSTSSADHQQRSSLTQPPTSNWKSGSTDITELQFTGTPGLQVPVPLTALEYVQLFTLTDSDFEYIAKETNRYAEQFFAKTPIESLPPHSRLRAWKDTNEDELKLFFALVIAMGLVVKPTLEDYWSLDEVLETPFFGTVMTRNRFELIFKFLHAADNEKAKKRGEDGYDPVYRIREMNNRYLDRCRNVYVPERDLALDEATMLWKGHISYRVYNPKKPAKFGVKIYEVCECVSGYVVDWQVYTGKTSEPQEHGHSYRVVFDLLRDQLRGLGHRLYVDRYYSSPKLFSDLFEHKIAATGTVMPTRKGMPQEAKTLKLKRGEQAVYSSGEMQCLKWKDKRDIYMLTTAHSCAMKDTGKVDRKTGENIQKPECILHYNDKMGGVDRNDQLSKYYSFARKVMKVWKKEFFFLMNTMVLQGYIIYKKYAAQSEMTQSEFRLAVVRELITTSKCIELLPKHAQRRSSVDSEPLLRLAGRHFPAFIPCSEKKEHPQRKCVVCTARKIRKESIYWCSECKVALCVVPCFGDYHLRKHYAAYDDNSDSD